MSRTSFDRSLSLGAYAIVGLMLLWQCRPARTSAEREPLGAASVTTLSEPGNPPMPAAKPSATLAPALEMPAAWSDGPSSPHAQPRPSAAANTSGGTVKEVLDRLEPVDLDLYARIERETHRDVPQEVRSIVDKRRTGATRSQLASEIQDKVQEGQVRLLMAHWLEEAFGTGFRPPNPLGTGSGPSLVRPTQRKSNASP